MNRQEVFNKVATHLLTQKRKALNLDTGYCQYLCENGDKCAIGALIPDGHEAQRSGYTVGYSFFRSYPDLMELWEVSKDGDVDFLFALQNIHDGSDVDYWPERLRLFAQSCDLTMPEVP